MSEESRKAKPGDAPRLPKNDASAKQLDKLLRRWPYEFGEVSARIARGADGREVIQMRVDLGVLQMEVENRPDGDIPMGERTFYDALLTMAFEEGDAFSLDMGMQVEVDREFMQFYHRRIAWLALREFDRAVADADHTLALMDFSTAHAPDEEWADQHEQYRPFVLFHRTQALALSRLEQAEPALAVEAIRAGLKSIQEVFVRHEIADEFESDELVMKLREMKRSLVDHYEVEPSLSEQLAEAIAREQYERAANLRDEIARRGC